MNTSELRRCCIKLDSTLAVKVLPRDLLPSKEIRRFPAAFIVNTDSSKEPGRHWVAFYLENEHHAEFFDSFGNSARYLANEFGAFLKRNVTHSIHNTKELQGKDSTVCGQYCLFFLYHRCRRVAMADIVQMFSEDRKENDCLVSTFTNTKFGCNFPVSDVRFFEEQKKLRDVNVLS